MAAATTTMQRTTQQHTTPADTVQLRRSMADPQTTSQLIGEIYDAALEPALWPQVMEKVADFVGGQAAGVFTRNADGRAGRAFVVHGLDHVYLKSYATTYWRHDPMVAALALCDIEQVVSLSDVVPHDEFRRSVLFREWAQPQGFVDSLKAVLDKSATRLAYLSVCRSERAGLADDEMRHRMRQIVPHVRRALLIGKAIDGERAAAAMLTETLDGLSAGLFLVDAAGRIVHANTAAQQLLATHVLSRSNGGQLMATDPQDNQRLREVFATAGSHDQALRLKGIALPLTARDGERYVAHVLPLTSGERIGAINATASAAIVVRKATLQSPSLPGVIGAAYHLTPAELRVLLAIVDIGGVPDIAAELGVADSTVKTHLGRVFEKTGVSRQADLVKLVAGFATPLVE